MGAARAWTGLLGVVVALVGVLLLFLPHTSAVNGGHLSCGSAAAPADLPTTYCATDDWRFDSVATMAGGALITVVAGLWPALRPTRGPARNPSGITN